MCGSPKAVPRGTSQAKKRPVVSITRRIVIQPAAITFGQVGASLRISFPGELAPETPVALEDTTIQASDVSLYQLNSTLLVASMYLANREMSNWTSLGSGTLKSIWTSTNV